MFSRRERILRTQVPAALATGRRFSSPHFVVVLPREARGYTVIIPKKVLRLSSARHRLKRQILEVLRTLPLPAALIVFPRASAYGVHYQDIKTELGNLLATIRT